MIYCEDFFATVRTRVSRLVRKSLSFFKSATWHKNAIDYFFWQYNLTRHPYFWYTIKFDSSTAFSSWIRYASMLYVR